MCVQGNSPKSWDAVRVRSAFVVALTIAAVLLVGLALQPSLSAQAQAPQDIPRTTLYIIFLHLHGADAQARAGGKGNGASVENKANRMHVNPADIQVIDEAAKTFVQKETALAQEARQYHRDCEAARKAVDPDVVRSFTVRREALASDAFAAIRSKLSPESFAGLQQFLDSDIRKSIGPFRR